MMLRLPQPEPDWSRLGDQPEERARQLFGLPRKAFATAITEPMATPASLVHYARRTYLDEAISDSNPVVESMRGRLHWPPPAFDDGHCLICALLRSMVPASCPFAS